MTTEDIIKDLRYLSDQPAHTGVSETMTLAANAIEGLGLRFDKCVQTRNDACAEIKRLEQELSDSTSHYNGIINRLRSDINERSDKLEGQEEISQNLYYECGRWILSGSCKNRIETSRRTYCKSKGSKMSTQKQIWELFARIWARLTK